MVYHGIPWHTMVYHGIPYGAKIQNSYHYIIDCLFPDLSLKGIPIHPFNGLAANRLWWPVYLPLQLLICLPKGNLTMVHHGMPWYAMVYHGIPWYTMVYLGIPWYTMVYHGILWYTMVCHGIPWYTMEYHGIPTLVYHGMP